MSLALRTSDATDAEGHCRFEDIDPDEQSRRGRIVRLAVELPDSDKTQR